jgi:LysM repeat protein
MNSGGLKLYLFLLGSKAPGRHVEQHDFFLGIGHSISELVPLMRSFWPEAGNSLHADGWREVNYVDGYAVQIVPATTDNEQENASNRLFFINLGGYQPDRLEEQHYTVLTVQPDKAAAIAAAKKTVFFKTNTIKGTSANSHIDDKYGIDVDDIYRVEDMLLPEQKAAYAIQLIPSADPKEDVVQLGYFKMDKLVKMFGDNPGN